MNKTSRMAITGIFIAGLCALSALCGFVYGTYIQFDQIVFGNQVALRKDLRLAQGCAGPEANIERIATRNELTERVSNYSAEYKALHEAFPRKAIGIALSAWMLRNTIPDGALTPPDQFKRTIEAVEKRKRGRPSAESKQ